MWAHLYLIGVSSRQSIRAVQNEDVEFWKVEERWVEGELEAAGRAPVSGVNNLNVQARQLEM